MLIPRRYWIHKSAIWPAIIIAGVCGFIRDAAKCTIIIRVYIALLCIQYLCCVLEMAFSFIGKQKYSLHVELLLYVALLLNQSDL